ncbi:hypothetical protein DRO69_04975 [Candidatus Bathyarchaeota archaeon]|nr:MAG: hypothetical protein DRO69_04975 [Candidatus Bathyarchaeota archaeon]
MVLGAEPWPYITITIAAVSVALFLLLAMRGKGKEKETLAEFEPVEKLPFKIERTVTSEETKKAKKRLRTLDIEREVLSYAIRRFYEAQAEGKISEEERERLARKYKERMMKIKDLISKSEAVVALHELETMQEDLIKMFSDRFDEVNRKISELRAHVKVKPIIEAPVPTPAPPKAAPPTREVKKVRKRAPPKKTEAEKRIEEIKAEVEKVLERLGQIEVEA